MARWLNKPLWVIMLVIFAVPSSFSQNESTASTYKDYKSQEQFYKFRKRAKVIAAWQINQLKNGALVVRLKTNKKIINALIAQGQTVAAREKTIETYIVNKNTMTAYVNNFFFCKLYFIYSDMSDSLLRGARAGIFLDTNLFVNPAIIMTESFYLLAERDYIYNSSIGFVPQDSAKHIKEVGNPVREMGVVLKNKYGHQLKPPFPYYIKDKTFINDGIPYFVVPGLLSQTYTWAPAKDIEASQKLKKNNPGANEFVSIKIKKQFTNKNLPGIVGQLNTNLEEFYKGAFDPDKNKLGPNIKPYLY